MSRRKPLNAENGFTLMEIIMAVFIFLTGVVGVISLFAAASTFHLGARDKTLSTLALEEVRSRIECDLASGGLRDGKGNLKPQAEGELAEGGRYRYRVELLETGDPGQSSVVARIYITWKEKGKERGESFDYVFRPGPAMSASVAMLKNRIEQSRRSGPAREGQE